jgi:hypothetical protein
LLGDEDAVAQDLVVGEVEQRGEEVDEHGPELALC